MYKNKYSKRLHPITDIYQKHPRQHLRSSILAPGGTLCTLVCCTWLRQLYLILAQTGQQRNSVSWKKSQTHEKLNEGLLIINKDQHMNRQVPYGGLPEGKSNVKI